MPRDTCKAGLHIGPTVLNFAGMVMACALVPFSESVRADQSAATSTDAIYVAPNGDDASPGTLDSPLRTVQRCATIAVAGQTCWLRAGTYRETVRPAQSGTASAPITFAAYAGEVVTISGADPVSGFVAHQGSVFRAPVTLPVNGVARDDAFGANQIFSNGKLLPQARHPNGPQPFDGINFMQPPLTNSGVSVNGTALTITGQNVPTIPGGWNGAVIWTNEWFVSRTAVVTQTEVGKLTAQTTDAGGWDRAGFWWTLTGALGALDAPGEWHYDAQARQLYLAPPDGTGNAPANVEAKQREFAFDFSARSFIAVKNLSIFAATITTDTTSEGIVLDGVDAKYVSHYLTLPPLPDARIQPGTDGFGLIGAHIHDSGIQLRGKNHRLIHSSVAYSAGNLVLLEGQGHLIKDTILHDANYLSSYAAAVQISGRDHRVLYNRIYNAGRSAINVDWKLTGFSLPGIEIGFNDIYAFGALSSDLGGIYVCCRMNTSGTRIHHNRVRDPYTFSPFWDVAGIYFDLNSYNATFDHNLIYGINNGNNSKSFKIGNEFADSLERVFNNTLLHANDFGGRMEGRNNILRATANYAFTSGGNNLFSATDPLFTDPATGDFSLRTNSPAIDAGAAIPGITDDAIGTPDIGAIESGRAAWVVGPQRRACPVSSK